MGHKESSSNPEITPPHRQLHQSSYANAGAPPHPRHRHASLTPPALTGSEAGLSQECQQNHRGQWLRLHDQRSSSRSYRSTNTRNTTRGSQGSQYSLHHYRRGYSNEHSLSGNKGSTYHGDKHNSPNPTIHQRGCSVEYRAGSFNSPHA